MARYLILSNSYSLIRIASERIAFVSSDGSYTKMTLIDGKVHVFSFNLANFEKTLEQQLGSESQVFIRLGRGLIINCNLIYTLNISKQELILSSGDSSKEFTLTVPKEALKTLKSLLEAKLKSRRIGI